MSSDTTRELEQRTLIAAPTAKDGQITRALLAREGISCVLCADLLELSRELDRGAGAVVMTEESISAGGIERVVGLLDRQPEWSELPVVMLMRGGTQSPAATRVLAAMRNVTLLERPAPMRSVVSAVQAALRGRERQYQIRDQFRAIRDAEARARELQEQLELAVNASELGTFHCDIPLNRIVWNERCKAHFWLPHDAEVDFELFYSIVHPEDRERVRRAVHECVFGDNIYDIEFRAVSPTGEVRWIRATGRTSRDANHAPVRFDGTTHDVTDRKLGEEEREHLLRSEQMARAESERAGRVKDEFLATLSHELRTPLNAILGWSQLIQHVPRDDAMLSEGLSVIERNARVQVQLIDDLLDMSRIISGKLRLDVQRVDMASVIEAAIETVKPAAQAREIRLHTVLHPRAGAVPGDPSRLQQVVWNLLSNAIKFTPRGGHVQVSLQPANSEVEINVSDSGKGIKPEFLPHVFERFRQADASTTRAHGGLGLGLAIVKHLVELHGGTIQAQSDGEGQGSTFSVMLPAAVVQQEPSTERRIHLAAPRNGPLDCSSTSLERLKILVVDDEPDARSLIKRVLEECRATVITAGSAAEALPLVESENPDILVSDIGMPIVDGYEFLRQVRALGGAGNGRIPAIALTAFARSEDRTRALLAGYLVHVSKPVEPQELVATVASVAGRTGHAGVSVNDVELTPANDAANGLAREAQVPRNPEAW